MEGTVEIGGNRLLQALDPQSRAARSRDLTCVDLGLRDYVYRANQVIDHVYFPIDGVISLVADVEDSLPVEVATVGNEGMVGLPLSLGARTMPGDAFSPSPGRRAECPGRSTPWDGGDCGVRRGAAHHVVPLRHIPSVVIALAMAAGARAWLKVERDPPYHVAGTRCGLAATGPRSWQRG